MQFGKLALCISAMVGLVACENDTDGDGASDLELDFGGFDTGDEAIMFDDGQGYADDGMAEGDVEDDAADDGTEEDAAETLADTEDAIADGDGDEDERGALFALRVIWGRHPVDPSATNPVVWNPTLTTDCGVLSVVRRIKLEADEGVVRPRTDAQSVSVTSTTLPAWDGIALVLAVPAAELECAETGYVRFASDAVGEELTVPISELYHTVQRYDVDDENAVLLMAHQRERGSCVRGFIEGRFRREYDDEGNVLPGLGRFRGRVLDEFGDLRGHIKGIYGVNKAGLPVWKAKLIDTNGTFTGLARGRYEEGKLGGRWLVKGDKGARFGRMRGRYLETPEDIEDGGVFHMRYASEACKRPVDGRDIDEARGADEADAM